MITNKWDNHTTTTINNIMIKYTSITIIITSKSTVKKTNKIIKVMMMIALIPVTNFNRYQIIIIYQKVSLPVSFLLSTKSIPITTTTTTTTTTIIITFKSLIKIPSFRHFLSYLMTQTRL